MSYYPRVGAGERYPLEPLRAMFGPDGGWRPFAAWLGVTDGTLRRWAAQGGIPELYADDIAVHVGAHPCELWPGWDQAIPEAEVG